MKRLAESLASLDGEQRKRIEKLARIRGETPQDLIKRFGLRKLKKIPRRGLKHTARLLRQTFVRAGVDGNDAFIEVRDGRRFYGHLSEKLHRREFEYVRDLASPVLTEETYLVALDVTSRYLTDWSWYPGELLPGRGGAVVEVGAYLGHKAIRFVDQCIGTSGKLLAIEMLPDNVRLLRRNIETNRLTGCVDVVESGVWSGSGRRNIRGGGRQRNSLVNLDKLKGASRQDVATETLDTVLREWDRPVIDFLVVTANGAEIDVLEGLQDEWERIKVIYVAACYTVDGKSTYDRCLRVLKQRQCTILPQSTEYVIYAVTARYADHYRSQRSPSHD